MKRRETLTNALLFGNAELVKEHEKQIKTLIETASQPLAHEEGQFLLPQLVEAYVQRNDPNVRLEFVFDPAVTPKQKQEALKEIGKMLPGPAVLKERPTIITPQENVHAEICANKEKSWHNSVSGP